MIQRMLFGELPLSFLWEVLLRTLFLFFLLIASLRFTGRRMSARISRNEMGAIVVLAAAIGIPLQSPERGLLEGVMVCAVVLFVQRWVASRSQKDQRFETRIQGTQDLLVRDGVLQPHAMKRSRVGRERVFAELRTEGIFHLGEVRRLYLETSGQFSLIRASDPRPGLSVLPSNDPEMFRWSVARTRQWVCESCGNPAPEATLLSTAIPCPCCEAHFWVQAVSMRPEEARKTAV